MQQLNCTFARDRDDKSYYDSLTNGWGGDGPVLAREIFQQTLPTVKMRNPPADTANRKLV
jgi:hypothetical protein